MNRNSARKWFEKIALAFGLFAIAALGATFLYTMGMERSAQPDPSAGRVIPFMEHGIVYVSSLDMTILHTLYFLMAAFWLFAAALFAVAAGLKRFSKPN